MNTITWDNAINLIFPLGILAIIAILWPDIKSWALRQRTKIHRPTIRDIIHWIAGGIVMLLTVILILILLTLILLASAPN